MKFYTNEITVKGEEGEIKTLLDLLWRFTLNRDGSAKEDLEFDMSKLDTSPENDGRIWFGLMDFERFFKFALPDRTDSIPLLEILERTGGDNVFLIDCVHRYENGIMITGATQCGPIRTFFKDYLSIGPFKGLYFNYSYHEDEHYGYDPDAKWGWTTIQNGRYLEVHEDLKFWSYMFSISYWRGMRSFMMTYHVHADTFEDWREELQWFIQHEAYPYMNREDREEFEKLIRSGCGRDLFFVRFITIPPSN